MSTTEQRDRDSLLPSYSGWIFTSRQHQHPGRHLDPTSINRLLQDYLDAAGLPRVTVHGLRHSFCTWLLSKGVPVRDVQQIVGHSKPSITLNMYWQAVPGAEERVSAEAGKLFSPGPRPAFPRISPTRRPARPRLRLVQG